MNEQSTTDTVLTGIGLEYAAVNFNKGTRQWEITNTQGQVLKKFGTYEPLMAHLNEVGFRKEVAAYSAGTNIQKTLPFNLTPSDLISAITQNR